MYYDFPMGAAASAGGGGSCGSDEEEFDDTSIFENKAGLSDDMRFLASMPELCDITFLVGETREPVCAVKAVLGARSRCAAANMCTSREVTFTTSLWSSSSSLQGIPEVGVHHAEGASQGEGDPHEGRQQAEGIHQEEL